MTDYLQIRKLFINSDHRTADSTASRFKINLDRTLDIKDGVFCFLDDVVMPRTFKTIEPGYNDKIYVKLEKTTDLNNPSYFILSITEGVYGTSTFTTALQTAFDTINHPELGAPATGNFIVSYNDPKEELTIKLADIATNDNWQFEIYTDWMLKHTDNWGFVFNTTPGSVISDPQTANIIIGNTQRITLTYDKTRLYTCDFLNLNPIREIYISSPNIGGYNTLSTSGAMNHLIKLPISVPFGYLITNLNRDTHPYIDVSKQSLRNLEFSIRYADGKEVNMRNQAVTFSLVFIQEK